MSKTKLPEPTTQVYVDWIHYSRYLEKVYKKDFEKHRDPLWSWFCGTGDFHNGCFVHMETAKVLGYPEGEPEGDAVKWFADRIFEDYSVVADKYGTIKLWVWW